MKIRLVGAELFHADGWTGRNNEVNNWYSQFCERASKPHSWVGIWNPNLITTKLRVSPLW